MHKFIIYLFFVLTFFNVQITNAMVNPWCNCKNDLLKAKDVAGFDFDIPLSNYIVRAMYGIYEIVYIFDEDNEIAFRKSNLDINNGDISGDYNKYLVNYDLKMNNDGILHIRGRDSKIFVATFKHKDNLYSISSSKGIDLSLVKVFYEMIINSN